MKHFEKTLIKQTIFIVAFSVFTVALSAQEGSMQTYEEAKKEITETFGTFPSLFDAFNSTKLRFVIHKSSIQL